MNTTYTIENALESDRQAILDVMRPWNMHHIPSPEMEEMDISSYFVARMDGKVDGAAGYKVISQTLAKTTLLGVLPEQMKLGIGKALQNKRLQHLYRIGVKTIITNSDRPETIEWLKKSYGFREIGTLKKISSFGDPSIDHWTTLEMDLLAYMQKADKEAASREYIARNEPHPLAPYPPFLINVCLTGMIPRKKDTPHVPVSPEEIVADAVAVHEAGAQIVHVHAREESGEPTWKASIYEKILSGIRRECPDMICCVSCSGRDWPDFERRSEVLDLTGPAKPDMASLTLGSLNFPMSASVNAPEMIQRLATKMAEKGIRPELEVFDTGMVAYSKFLERKGFLDGKKYFNLLLGSLGMIPATIGDLGALVNALPDNSTWAAAGIGVFQLPMNTAAIVAGGGVRVGLEDNIFYDSGKKKLATNAELVQRVVRLAEECGRRLATAAEARQMTGLICD